MRKPIIQSLLGILSLIITLLMSANTIYAQELNFDPGVFYLYKNNEPLKAVSETEEWTITFGTTDTLGHKYNHPVDFTFLGASVLDSLTCPLQDVDSLLMYQPEPEMLEDVFVITREHFPYILEVDIENNTIYFSPEVNRHFDMPNTKGSKVVCNIEKDPFPIGFIGIISNCYWMDGRWVMECKEPWYDLRSFYKSLICTTRSDERSKEAHANSPKRAKPTKNELENWLLQKEFNYSGKTIPAEDNDYFKTDFKKAEFGIYFDANVDLDIQHFAPSCIVKFYTYYDFDASITAKIGGKWPIWRRSKSEKDFNNMKKISKYGKIDLELAVYGIDVEGSAEGTLTTNGSYYQEIDLFKAEAKDDNTNMPLPDAKITLNGHLILLSYVAGFSFTFGLNDTSEMSDEEKKTIMESLEKDGKTYVHGELEAEIDCHYLEGEMVIQDYPYIHPTNIADLRDNYNAIKDSRWIKWGSNRPHLEVKSSGRVNLGVWTPTWDPEPVSIDDMIRHPFFKFYYFPQNVDFDLDVIAPNEVDDNLSFFRSIPVSYYSFNPKNFCSWDFGSLALDGNIEFDISNYRSLGTFPVAPFAEVKKTGNAWARKGSESYIYPVFKDGSKFYSPGPTSPAVTPYDLSTLSPKDGFGETTLNGKFDPAVLSDLSNGFIKDFRVGFIWGPKNCELESEGNEVMDTTFDPNHLSSSNSFSVKIETEDEGQYKYAAIMYYTMKDHDYEVCFVANKVQFSPRSLYSPVTLPATDVYYDRGTLNAEISTQMAQLAINDPNSQVGFRYVTHDKNGVREASFDKYLERDKLNGVGNFYSLQLTGLTPNRKVSYTAVTRVKDKVYELPLTEQSFTTRDPYDPTTKGNEVDRNQATIHGEIDEWLSISPEYLDKVTIYFEYSEKEDMSSPKTIDVEKVASQNRYKHNLKGLKWGTKYYYRFVLEAPDEANTVRRGKVEHFETPDLFKPQTLTAYPTAKGLAFKVTMLPEAEEIINLGVEVIQMTIRYARDKNQLGKADYTHDVVMTWRTDKSDPTDIKYYYCDTVPVLDVNRSYYYRAVSLYNGHESKLDSYDPVMASVPSVKVYTDDATFDFTDAKVDMTGHIDTSLPDHLTRYKENFVCSFEFSTVLPPDNGYDLSIDVQDVKAQYSTTDQTFKAENVYMPSGEDEAIDYYYRGVFTQDTYPDSPKVYGEFKSCTVYFYDPGVMAYVAPRYLDANGQWQRTELPAEIKMKLERRRAERAAAGRRFNE